MAKHASKPSDLPLVARSDSAAVEVPLAMLDVLAGAENAFFELRVEVGQFVLPAVPALPRWL